MCETPPVRGGSAGLGRLVRQCPCLGPSQSPVSLEMEELLSGFLGVLHRELLHTQPQPRGQGKRPALHPPAPPSQTAPHQRSEAGVRQPHP